MTIERDGGLSRMWQLAVFVIAFAALVSRRPDAIFYPQFFGEDGAIWYPEAYMFGWFNALFSSQNGYYQTLPRLAAAVAQLFALQDGPLVMNVIGLSLQVLPVTFLLSSRCREWGPLWVRGVLAAVYLALPNSKEVHAAIEEGQWHLAHLSALVVLAAAPRTIGGRVFDAAVVLLGGVSGPFGMLLLPIAGLMWWKRRDPWRLALVGMIALGAGLQLSALAATGADTRPKVGLGATPALFVKLLGLRVVAGALFGEGGWHAARMLHIDHLIYGRVPLAILAVLGAAMLTYVWLRATLEVKLFVGFAFLVLAASLGNPMVSNDTPQWQVLASAGGIRYWFFPTLGMASAIAWCAAAAPDRVGRWAGRLGLAAMVIGIVCDWKYPAWPDMNFPASARRFDGARPGSHLALPIYPPPWEMRITKKMPGCQTLPIGWPDQMPTAVAANGSLHVSGWVIAYRPIKHVAVQIDDRDVIIVPMNVPRPDVDAYYPRVPVPVKGFAGDLDLSRAAPGPHRLEFKAIQSDGCDAAFLTALVTR